VYLFVAVVDSSDLHGNVLQYLPTVCSYFADIDLFTPHCYYHYTTLHCTQAEVVELKAQLKKAQQKYDTLQ
jgi:hypothetical protein